MPCWDDETKLTLYTGTWFGKSMAIKEHAAAKGWNWKRCKRNGDVCVKVKIVAA